MNHEEGKEPALIFERSLSSWLTKATELVFYERPVALFLPVRPLNTMKRSSGNVLDEYYIIISSFSY